MGVYFFYRCPYQGPAGSYLRRFADDTVLDWFRARWHILGGADDKTVWERVAGELGCEVYSFAAVFAEAAKQSWSPPTTAEQLGGYVQGAVYENHVLCPSPHLLQVDTDDDEVGLAYYFFDDHYLARHGKRAAFLLRDGWQLPPGCGSGGFRAIERTTRLKPRGRGQGTTYIIDLDHVGDMVDLVDGCRIDAVRLPELMKYLARSTPDPEGGHLLLLPRAFLTVPPVTADPLERTFLQAIRESPGEDATWDAYSDWLQDRGELPAGLHLLHRALTWAGRYYDLERDGRLPSWPEDTDHLPTIAEWAEPSIAAIEGSKGDSRSLIQVEDHVAQLCLHYNYWGTFDRHLYHNWIYFDDLWASAHPDLGNAILRYVRRWDVLSTSRVRDDDT
jgi:uncharacterized protein (TIGR02996 family)